MVELLVVVAIIVVLAAILLPVLSRAKFKAREVICISNLRENSMGLMLYADDFNGAYPHRQQVNGFYPYSGLSDDNSSENDYHELIPDYIPLGETYKCPLIGADWRDEWPGAKGYRWHGYGIPARWVAYKLNYYYDPQTGNKKNYKDVIPMRVGQYIDRPIVGDKIMFYPAYNLFTAPHVRSNAHPMGDSMPLVSQPEDAESYNFAYGDGSVLRQTKGFKKFYDNRNGFYWLWRVQ